MRDKNAYIAELKDPSKEAKEEILELLKITNEEFVPKLSERKSTHQMFGREKLSSNRDSLWQYYSELIPQKFIVAVDSGKVVGFLSYIPNKEVDLFSRIVKADYVSTIIVHPDYRSNGIGRRFYEKLLKNSESRNIVTRTWSTNLFHLQLLHKLGFKESLIIKDDRGDGIDTIYLRKSL